jgi:small multidrug resistance pump
MKLISYLYLDLAGSIFCGIIANGYFLKISEGFTKVISSALASVLIILAIFFLSRAMNHIPVGFTYATYRGLTITGVTLFGVYKFQQTPNFYGLIGIIFIIVGVFLVNYFGRINS